MEDSLGDLALILWDVMLSSSTQCQNPAALQDINELVFTAESLLRGWENPHRCGHKSVLVAK